MVFCKHFVRRLIVCVLVGLYIIIIIY